MNNWNKSWQQENKNRKKNKKERERLVIFLSVALLFVGFLLSLCMGAARLTLGELWKGIMQKGGSSMEGNIFWYARFPRTMACALAGAALAVSGAVIQAVLANGLASPGIIGVNSGAGFGIVLSCALGALGG